MKTPEELAQYIFSYKAEQLSKSNAETDKLFDRANAIADRLSSLLITIASVLLTILGGFIASNSDTLEGEGVKVLLTLTILFLLGSIGLGLYAKNQEVKFWNKWALHAHDKGRIISEDSATTYDDLVALRSKIIAAGEKIPQHSPLLPNILQTTFFTIGLLIFITIIMVSLYA